MSKDREHQIAARAYQLWEEEGRPHGAHERHWIQALREVEEAVRAEEASEPEAKATAKSKSAAKRKPSTKASVVSGAKAKPAGTARVAAQAARAGTGETKTGKAPAKKLKE